MRWPSAKKGSPGFISRATLSLQYNAYPLRFIQLGNLYRCNYRRVKFQIFCLQNHLASHSDFLGGYRSSHNRGNLHCTLHRKNQIHMGRILYPLPVAAYHYRLCRHRNNLLVVIPGAGGHQGTGYILLDTLIYLNGLILHNHCIANGAVLCFICLATCKFHYQKHRYRHNQH